MATTMARGRLRLMPLQNQDIMVGMATDMDMDMAMVGMVIMDTMVRGLLMLSLDIMVDMVMDMVMDMDMDMDMATDMAMVMVMDTMVKQQLLYCFMSETSAYGKWVLLDLVMRNITQILNQ